MNELSQWLQDALERLEYWSTQAMVVPQDPEMVRDHLYTFLVRHSHCHCHCQTNSFTLAF